MIDLSSLVELDEYFLDQIQCEKLPKFGADSHFPLGDFSREPIGQDEAFKNNIALIGGKFRFLTKVYLIAVDHGLGVDFGGSDNFRDFILFHCSDDLIYITYELEK